MSAPAAGSPAAGEVPPGYQRAAALEDVPAGGLRAVRLDGLALVLCRVGAEVFALEDNCSHQHFPLSRGELEEGELTCEWHGARFDVRTGQPLALPAVSPVRTFDVRVVGGDVYVRTEGELPTPAEALIQRGDL
ncbi:MAG: non-heme iron oxygenase ferredoxin subunit [Gemmatimonadota bacterium]